MTPAIYQWAARNGVSMQALHELQALFGMHGGHAMPDAAKGVSEGAVAAVVRLEAARKGVRLFRNNVGVLMDATGRSWALRRCGTDSIKPGPGRQDRTRNSPKRSELFSFGI